jgi:uncharacterized protein (TIGR02246 family)
LLCLAACSPQNGGTASQQSTSNAAARTAGEAPAQLGDDEQAIRALGERHAKAVAGRDTARVGEIYAEDVVYVPHDDPVEKGIAAARAAWVRGLSVPNTQIQYTPVEIEVGDGSMAYERGTVKTTMKGEVYPGNYLYVWRKRDGEWRVALWMWNMQGGGGR